MSTGKAVCNCWGRLGCCQQRRTNTHYGRRLAGEFCCAGSYVKKDKVAYWQKSNVVNILMLVLSMTPFVLCTCTWYEKEITLLVTGYSCEKWLTFALATKVYVCSIHRVRNCAFLVANATENFALATRILRLVARRRPAIFEAILPQ